MVIRRLPPVAAMLLLLLSPEIRARSTAAIRTHFAKEKSPALRISGSQGSRLVKWDPGLCSTYTLSIPRGKGHL